MAVATIGTKHVVNFQVISGTPVIKSLDFTGLFTYDGVYVSNIVVQFDDIANTTNDHYNVTFYWTNGAAPDLTTVTIAQLLSDAKDAVNAVLPLQIP